MIKNNKGSAGTGHVVGVDTPLADLSFLRAAVVMIAEADICLATLVKDSKELHIDARQAILSHDVEKIRDFLFRFAGQQGWVVPAESQVRVWINGESQKENKRSPAQSVLRGLQIFAVAFPDSQPVLLCLAGFDREPDPGIKEKLQLLATNPVDGLSALWRNILQQRSDFEILLANMIDGVVLCDDNGRIRFLNEKARQLSGMDVLPRRGDLLPPNPACDLRGLLQEAIGSGVSESNKVVRVENSNPRLLGVHIHHSKNLGRGEIGWLMIIRDITANWQSDQMRSMISVASHELNTPLASIISTFDLLLDKETGPLTASQERFLSIARDDMHRMQRLLRDLLDLSRLEERNHDLDRRRHIRIEFIINRVIESYSQVAHNKGVDLRTNVASGLSGFTGDRDRITQILMNLVDNAIKYSAVGSEVVVGAAEDNDALIVSVVDQGVGITPEKREIIFERFVQLDNLPEGAERGFGLGLSIAREIVHSHHGRIWVESEVGKGSTFYFTIPKEKAA